MINYVLLDSLDKFSSKSFIKIRSSINEDEILSFSLKNKNLSNFIRKFQIDIMGIEKVTFYSNNVSFKRSETEDESVIDWKAYSFINKIEFIKDNKYKFTFDLEFIDNIEKGDECDIDNICKLLIMNYEVLVNKKN